jgi:hypothetical protein
MTETECKNCKKLQTIITALMSEVSFLEDKATRCQLEARALELRAKEDLK